MEDAQELSLWGCHVELRNLINDINKFKNDHLFLKQLHNLNIFGSFMPDLKENLIPEIAPGSSRITREIRSAVEITAFEGVQFNAAW